MILMLYSPKLLATSRSMFKAYPGYVLDDSHTFAFHIYGMQGMFFLRTFHWGQKGARDNYSLQIRNIMESAYQSLGERPVIIGECGVPMDMKYGTTFTAYGDFVDVFFFLISSKRKAFQSNDWTWQSRMMDAMITALERSLIGFT